MLQSGQASPLLLEWRDGVLHLDISDCHQYLITGLRTQLKIPSWLTSTIRLTSRSLVCSPIVIKQFNNKDWEQKSWDEDITQTWKVVDVKVSGWVLGSWDQVKRWQLLLLLQLQSWDFLMDPSQERHAWLERKTTDHSTLILIISTGPGSIWPPPFVRSSIKTELTCILSSQQRKTYRTGLTDWVFSKHSFALLRK